MFIYVSVCVCVFKTTDVCDCVGSVAIAKLPRLSSVNTDMQSPVRFCVHEACQQNGPNPSCLERRVLPRVRAHKHAPTHSYMHTHFIQIQSSTVGL